MAERYIPIKPHMETIKETAKLFGVSEYLVRNLALSGKIVAVRITGRILINCDKFAEFLNTSKLETETEQTSAVDNIRRICC